MRTIEIDYDIHRLIQLERRSFDEPEYIALRRLLNAFLKGLDDVT